MKKPSRKSGGRASHKIMYLGRVGGKGKNYERFLPVFPPRPGFGEVSVVLKTKNQVVLVSRLGRFQVARTLIVEAKFLDVAGLRDNPHPGLVVGWAIVHQGDAVAVDAV